MLRSILLQAVAAAIVAPLVAAAYDVDSSSTQDLTSHYRSLLGSRRGGGYGDVCTVKLYAVIHPRANSKTFTFKAIQECDGLGGVPPPSATPDELCGYAKRPARDAFGLYSRFKCKGNAKSYMDGGYVKQKLQISIYLPYGINPVPSWKHFVSKLKRGNFPYLWENQSIRSNWPMKFRKVNKSGKSHSKIVKAPKRRYGYKPRKYTPWRPKRRSYKPRKYTPWRPKRRSHKRSYKPWRRHARRAFKHWLKKYWRRHFNKRRGGWRARGRRHKKFKKH